ncbi:unnamed protein product, partial [Effrenium voratum]
MTEMVKYDMGMQGMHGAQGVHTLQNLQYMRMGGMQGMHEMDMHYSDGLSDVGSIDGSYMGGMSMGVISMGGMSMGSMSTMSDMSSMSATHYMGGMSMGNGMMGMNGMSGGMDYMGGYGNMRMAQRTRMPQDTGRSPVASLEAERQWLLLLLKLRSFPLDWRSGDEAGRRLDALGKEVRLSDLYAACPTLRKRVSSYGGLGKLWAASHQWMLPTQMFSDLQEAPKRRVKAPQVDARHDKKAWQQLLDDLMAFPADWNAQMHKDLRGALLGRQLHLAHRFAKCPGLRRQVDQEGGLCNLWQKLHQQAAEADPSG